MSKQEQVVPMEEPPGQCLSFRLRTRGDLTLSAGQVLTLNDVLPKEIVYNFQRIRLQHAGASIVLGITDEGEPYIEATNKDGQKMRALFMGGESEKPTEYQDGGITFTCPQS